jgi:hypothetical protein
MSVKTTEGEGLPDRTILSMSIQVSLGSAKIAVLKARPFGTKRTRGTWTNGPPLARI